MPKAQLGELYAHGLGVIDDARVEFGPGFNVITGETGAGKTLLLGALNLCLGNDAGATRLAARDELRASAVFVDRDGHEVVLTREAGATGRLRSAVNASPSSAEALRVLGEALVVVHGQHDSLALRTRSDVLAILDASAGISTHDLDHVRRRLRQARSARDELGGDLTARQRELELLEYQIDELEGASISSANELRDALEELTRLTDLRDGQAALASVLDELDVAGDDGLLGQLAQAIDRLPKTPAYDPAREVLLGALAQAREGVHARVTGGEGVIARERGRPIGRREVNRARVAGGHVAVRVARGHRDTGGGARGDGIGDAMMVVVVARRGGLHVAATRLAVRDGKDPLVALTGRLDTVDEAVRRATRPGETWGDAVEALAASYREIGHAGAWTQHYQGGPIAFEQREFELAPGQSDSPYWDVPCEVGHAVAWNPSLSGGAKIEETYLLGEFELEPVTRLEHEYPRVKVVE